MTHKLWISIVGGRLGTVSGIINKFLCLYEVKIALAILKLNLHETASYCAWACHGRLFFLVVSLVPAEYAGSLLTIENSRLICEIYGTCQPFQSWN